jgi:hypothetical protein
MSRHLGLWRTAERGSPHIGRRNLARGTTLPIVRRGCRYTGRATDTVHGRFTNSTALARGIHRDTVRAYLLGLHYIDRNSGGHLLGTKATLIMTIHGIRHGRSTRAQRRLGLRAERCHELEKHDGKAEMNLHG